MTLTVGSLFSGIGGIDLGLERAGHKVIWQSEIDPYCNKVLKKHWPKVTNYGDIKTIDWSTVERPDIICGGYPCQPFSTAGKRRGTDDPRHLWPWVRKAISELRPSYAMLENVRGHLSMGAATVIGELTEIGYDAEWRIISAAGMGAPHRRDRIIIVAYPTQLFSNGSDNYARNSQRPETVSKPRNGGRSQNVANANSAPRQQQQKRQVSKSDTQRRSKNVADTNNRRQQKFDAQIGCVPVIDQKSNGKSLADTDSEQLGQYRQSGNVRQTHSVWQHHGTGQTCYDGWQWWETEPDVGRVAHGVPNRVDRLRGLGNAVVPQVAELVGRLIGEHAKQFK
jgi:DNA (cytosine-5)-methyltransferase 1